MNCHADIILSKLYKYFLRRIVFDPNLTYFGDEQMLLRLKSENCGDMSLKKVHFIAFMRLSEKSIF